MPGTYFGTDTTITTLKLVGIEHAGAGNSLKIVKAADAAMVVIMCKIHFYLQATFFCRLVKVNKVFQLENIPEGDMMGHEKKEKLKQ